MSAPEYSRDAIEARLRLASERSRSVTSDTPRVDMSADAIELRLRQASELSHSCLRLVALGRAAGLVPSDRSTDDALD